MSRMCKTPSVFLYACTATTRFLFCGNSEINDSLWKCSAHCHFSTSTKGTKLRTECLNFSGWLADYIIDTVLVFPHLCLFRLITLKMQLVHSDFNLDRIQKENASTNKMFIQLFGRIKYTLILAIYFFLSVCLHFIINILNQYWK